MEGNQSHFPKKSSSFSSSRDEKHREIDRNLSLGSIKLEQGREKKEKHGEDTIKEEGDEEAAAEQEGTRNGEEAEANFATISEDIDKFISVLSIDDGQDQSGEPPEIPESTIEKFVALVEKEIVKYEAGDAKWSSDRDDLSLLEAIDRVSKLASAMTRFSSEPKYNQAMNRSGSVLHHSMCFLEDEFYSLLQDPRAKQDAGSLSLKSKRQSSFSRLQESERCVPPSSESSSGECSPAYPPEIVERLGGIADAMISAGYHIECCQVFAVARRNAFEAGLPSLGFEKVSIDDVVKMAWESLESEIATWIRAFRHIVTAAFTVERHLCEAVFADHRAVSDRLFRGFLRGATTHLLTFAEAVAMTKRSAKKLFKVIDIYETLRDVTSAVNVLLPDQAE